MAKKGANSARVYNIMQFEKHPITGQILLTENKIKEVLNRYSSINKWAYIIHDKDTYTNEDEKNDCGKTAGTLKPKHFHVVLQMKDNNTELYQVAAWFGIADNYVDKVSGRGGFLDCVQYLTHESEAQQKKKKYRYDDDAVQANFDWRFELDDRDAKRAKWGKKGDSLTPKQIMGQEIMQCGLTLRQAMLQNPVLYADNVKFFQQCRGLYLQNQPAPALRLNYYVYGQGGAGKGLFCRGVARSFFPNLQFDEDIYFEVGQNNASFEGYDGQPVIIWNDCRSFELMQKLGGRENVFNVFDTHPTKQRQNIKYGSTSLNNVVNLVNSTQPFRDFLDGLAGEYTARDGTFYKAEDKGQAYRRFPLITEIKENDFDLYINKGFLEDTSAFEEYISYRNIRGNLQTIAVRCGQNQILARTLTDRTLSLVTAQYNQLVNKFNYSALDEQAVLEELKGFGVQMLDLTKTEEQLQNQRNRHKNAQKFREKNMDILDILENCDWVKWV